MPSLVWSRSLQKEPQFLEVLGQDRATPWVRAHAADQCWEDPPAGSPGWKGGVTGRGADYSRLRRALTFAARSSHGGSGPHGLSTLSSQGEAAKRRSLFTRLPKALGCIGGKRAHALPWPTADYTTLGITQPARSPVHSSENGHRLWTGLFGEVSDINRRHFTDVSQPSANEVHTCSWPNLG